MLAGMYGVVAVRQSLVLTPDYAPGSELRSMPIPQITGECGAAFRITYMCDLSVQ